MPPICSVFIATSLDGYIARPDGAIDWLERLNATVPAGEDCGYARFMASVDALVMGCASFDKVRGFPGWPEYPFRVLKRQLGYTKVRYRGFAKNRRRSSRCSPWATCGWCGGG